MENTYVITATYPDGRPYQLQDGACGDDSNSVAAMGEQARDELVQALRAAGLTAHVRKG